MMRAPLAATAPPGAPSPHILRMEDVQLAQTAKFYYYGPYCILRLEDTMGAMCFSWSRL